MQRVWLRTNRQAGFSVVEVLLAATVFAVLVTALVGALIFGQRSTVTAGARARASLIAEEGLEAVRNIRDGAYANLADGTYGLAQTGNQWVLSGASDTTDIFTRQIIIASGGTNRKTVTSRVTWPQGATTATVDVQTQLTNWMGALVKSWANPLLAGSYNAANTNDALKVAVQGNYAYVVRTDGTPDFLIINISNPAAPTLAGSLNLAGSPTNIAVNGNYAYVTNTLDAGELQTINITNPAAPTLANTYNASGTGDGLGVAVYNNLVVVSRAANGGTAELLVMSIATPQTPSLVSSYGNNVTMREVFVAANNAYIATDSDTAEVMVVNLTIPALPGLVATVNLPGTTNALTVSGYGLTRVLVGQGSTLYALNTLVPLTTFIDGTFTIAGGGTIQDIDVDPANNLAFIGSTATGAEFQVVNVQATLSMFQVGTADIPGTTSTLNGVAYSASLNTVVGASFSDTQEVVTFIQN